MKNSKLFFLILISIFSCRKDRDDFVIKDDVFTYMNMTIYLSKDGHTDGHTDGRKGFDYLETMSKANLAICISRKEGYGHYINESRYCKTCILTLDSGPMNELISNNVNGFLLKNKHNYRKKNYKETKYTFIDAYPDITELKDTIIKCIKNKHNLWKYGIEGRKMYDSDKEYFVNAMEKIIMERLLL